MCLQEGGGSIGWSYPVGYRILSDRCSQKARISWSQGGLTPEIKEEFWRPAKQRSLKRIRSTEKRGRIRSRVSERRLYLFGCKTESYNKAPCSEKRQLDLFGCKAESCYKSPCLRTRQLDLFECKAESCYRVPCSWKRHLDLFGCKAENCYIAPAQERGSWVTGRRGEELGRSPRLATGQWQGPILGQWRASWRAELLTKQRRF